MVQLDKDEVVTLLVSHETGESHEAIARHHGVTEGALRYRLRRAATGSGDGQFKLCAWTTPNESAGDDQNNADWNAYARQTTSDT